MYEVKLKYCVDRIQFKKYYLVVTDRCFTFFIEYMTNPKCFDIHWCNNSVTGTSRLELCDVRDELENFTIKEIGR